MGVPDPAPHHPLHAVVVAFPLQGHITPLIHLCRKLILQGFVVTFVTTDMLSVQLHESNNTHVGQPPGDRACGIRVVGISDGLPSDHPRDGSDFSLQIQAMLGMRDPAEQLIGKLQQQFSPISCLISDVFVTWSYDVASSFGIPWFAFFTSNATAACVMSHARELVCKGIIPFRDSNGSSDYFITCIPGAPPLRPSEFPPSMQLQDISTNRFQFTLKIFEHLSKAAGLFLNTIYELEKKAIDALNAKVPVFPVGPLLLSVSGDKAMANEPEVNFWQGEDRCLKWLDDRSAGSVLYVSFGSISTFSEIQVKELALGLEASQQPFLWVIRPNAVRGSMSKALPDGFLERTVDRSLIISWAPQILVLSHPAIGGFLTHCGWNSILENVSVGGHPMLCWPDIAEQKVNCRLVVDDWEIGLEFKEGDDRIVDRTEVQRVVKLLMQGGERKERRTLATALMDLAGKAVKDGGSSAESLKCFVESIRERIDAVYRSQP